MCWLRHRAQGHRVSHEVPRRPPGRRRPHPGGLPSTGHPDGDPSPAAHRLQPHLPGTRIGHARAVKWVLGGCAVIAVASYSFVYAAVKSLLDEEWQPDWDEPTDYQNLGA